MGRADGGHAVSQPMSVLDEASAGLQRLSRHGRGRRSPLRARVVVAAVTAALLAGPLPGAEARPDHVDRTFGDGSGWVATSFGTQVARSGAPLRTSRGFVVPALTGNFFTPPALVAVRHKEDGRLDPRFGRQGMATVTVPGVTAAAGVVPPFPLDRLAGGLPAPGRTVAVGERHDRSLVLSAVTWPVAGPVLLPATLAATRLHADGRVDSGYGRDGVATLPVGPVVLGAAYTTSLGVHVLPDGAVLAVVWTMTLPPCGFFIPCLPPVSVVTLARLRPDGSPDSAFGPLGLRTSPSPPGYWYSSSALVKDGGVLLGGTDGVRAFVRRLTPEGTPDLRYGTAGTVVFDRRPDDFSFAAGVAALPDGSAAVAVHTTPLLALDWNMSTYDLHRLGPDVRTETTF